MKFLGVDYGKRKVGLATSEGLTASPFKVIEVSGLKDALEKIKHIIKSENIDQVVVGMPESGESYNMAKKFIKALDSPVVEADETLSTHQALGKKQEDAVSAAIILQEYLDAKS